MKHKRKTSNSAQQSAMTGLVDNLITCGKKRGTSNQLRSRVKAEAKAALTASNANQKFQLTPKGLLWAAVETFYGSATDIAKFDKFQDELVSRLSLLATEN